MRAARRVLGVAVFVALLVAGWRFAAVHPQPVQIDYWVGSTGEVALWVALLWAFAAGAFAVGALALAQLVRLALLARRYRKAIAKLEVEVHELRNLPLAPEAPDLEPGLGHALERGG